ncbi:MAG TPA: alanine racemase [Patescibacteria group bacterium]|nr:alanine racemase [Patescibacteria group bacterium]
MLSKNNSHKTWLEISKKALLHNFNVFQKIVGKEVKVVPVVKANAYGHDLIQVVSVLKNRTGIFAVDNIEEALTIRKISKDTRVIILGYIISKNFKSAVENNFSFVVYRLDVLKQIVSLKLNKKASVHLKIETGLNRQGVGGKELVRILDYIIKHDDQIFLEGVYTHFANVEDTLDSSYAINQLKRFNESLKIIKLKGFKIPVIHTAASAATFLLKDSHFGTVRAGIGLYGLWPSRETKIASVSRKMKIILKPVLSWKSIVVQVKEIQKGETVGYGRTWTARRRSRIAIVPVGYSDGFDRKLSNIGKVIVGNSFAPVIGRVAMNMIMIDVTDSKRVKADQTVIIIGTKGKLSISAEDIAEKIGTINYEVVSRINPLLPRIIV